MSGRSAIIAAAALLGVGVPGLPLAADPGAAQASIPAASDLRFSPPQGDYVLGCAGCHGVNGESHSNLVPSLKGVVGFYLSFAEGRAYLARVPNVAFSTLSDAQLAAVLNYMVFDIGAGSAPAGAKPYVAEEVGRLRKHPLTEVTLSAYRRGMVEILISQYHAPASLRVYGNGLYNNAAE